MEQRRKNLTQLFIPICLETLLYMLSGMVDTLMLSSVNDQAVGAVGTANTYIGIFIIMFSVILAKWITLWLAQVPIVAYQKFFWIPMVTLMNILFDLWQKTKKKNSNDSD